jgi:hypothetical protein
MTEGGVSSSHMRTHSQSVAAIDQPNALAKPINGKESLSAQDVDTVDDIVNRKTSEVIFEAEIRLETEGNEN